MRTLSHRIWSVGQVVKTLPFHDSNMGSNPVPIISPIRDGLCSNPQSISCGLGNFYFEEANV